MSALAGLDIGGTTCAVTLALREADGVAIAVPHPTLGQAIVVVASPRQPGTLADGDALLEFCRARMPNFMVPLRIEWREELPRNPNGKFDRPSLASQYRELLKDAFE